jgi:hypothetical protein
MYNSSRSVTKGLLFSLQLLAAKLGILSLFLVPRLSTLTSTADRRAAALILFAAAGCKTSHLLFIFLALRLSALDTPAGRSVATLLLFAAAGCNTSHPFSTTCVASQANAVTVAAKMMLPFPLLTSCCCITTNNKKKNYTLFLRTFGCCSCPHFQNWCC